MSKIKFGDYVIEITEYPDYVSASFEGENVCGKGWSTDEAIGNLILRYARRCECIHIPDHGSFESVVTDLEIVDGILWGRVMWQDSNIHVFQLKDGWYAPEYAHYGKGKRIKIRY